MARQMVDPHKGQPGPGDDAFGQHHPGQNPADQPRPGGHRHAIQLAQGQARLGQRLFDAEIQLFHMRPRRKFRHHPAEVGVQRRLSRHDRGQNLGPPAAQTHHRRRAVVAAAFDAKECQGVIHRAPVA